MELRKFQKINTLHKAPGYQCRSLELTWEGQNSQKEIARTRKIHQSGKRLKAVENDFLTEFTGETFEISFNQNLIPSVITTYSRRYILAA